MRLFAAQRRAKAEKNLIGVGKAGERLKAGDLCFIEEKMETLCITNGFVLMKFS